MIASALWALLVLLALAALVLAALFWLTDGFAAEWDEL